MADEVAGNPKSPFRTVIMVVLATGALAWSTFAPTATHHVRPGRIPIRYWHSWSAEWQIVVEDICKEYNQSQDKYEVIPLSIPNGAEAKFIMGAIGGDPPDVMTRWDSVIPTWSDSGLLKPIDEVMSPAEMRYFRANAYPIAQRLGTYRGKLFGVAIGINASALYIRPSLLEAGGYDPQKFPQTYEGLVQMGRKLDKFSKSRGLTQLGFMPNNLSGMSVLFGGGFYDWNKRKVQIETPQNLAALEAIVAEQRRLGYENVIRFNAGLNTASSSGGWPFIGGAYAVTIDGQWRVEQLRKFAPKLDYITAPIPPPKGGRPFGWVTNGNFMVIPKGAKHPDGAWDFIRFWSGLGNPARAAHLFVKGGWLPLTPATAAAPDYQKYIKDNPQFKTFVDLLPSANLQTAPPVAYQQFIVDRITSAEDRAVRGTVSPQEALKTLQLDLQRELMRRRQLGYGDSLP